MVEKIHGSSIQGPKSPISQPQPQQPQGPQLLPRNVPGTEDSGQKEGKKYQGPGQGVPASDFGIRKADMFVERSRNKSIDKKSVLCYSESTNHVAIGIFVCDFSH